MPVLMGDNNIRPFLSHSLSLEFYIVSMSILCDFVVKGSVINYYLISFRVVDILYTSLEFEEINSNSMASKSICSQLLNVINTRF
jgi:hypothetical protein